MKRIITLTLAVICLAAAAFAQEKKTVAVYVTGNCNEDIKKVVSSRTIAQIVRSRDYAAVERTLDFDEALRREQSYQHSGNVDDGQVIKLGKQFGAGLVCVADASKKDREYLFTARLINIETGLVISFSLAYANSAISNSEAISITDHIATQLLEDVTTTAGKQKLAVYVTNSSDVFKAKTVSSRLTQNFTHSGVYAVVDRTSDFRVELNRQHSGRVDDSQISRLGRQFGVNQVCIVDVSSSDYTAVRIINVETGIIAATAEKQSWGVGAVDEITRELTGYYPKNTPPHAASTQTWTFGDQTWSDAIQMPECNKTSFRIIPYTYDKPDCRSYTADGKTWYYYNWAYVIKNRVKLCPSPWQTPVRQDFSILYDYDATATTLTNEWGLGGGVFEGSYVSDVSYSGGYWSTSVEEGGSNTYGAFSFDYYAHGDVYVMFKPKNHGLQVRCVK
jgi:hypothetical protein